jgi:transcriptional regulator with XRE-family HTH domain
MIGEKMRKFRERSKKTTFEFADELQISVSTLSRLENGEIELSYNRLLEIAKLLNLSPIDFFDEKDLHITSPDFFEKYGSVESSYIRFILGQNENLQRENTRLAKELEKLMQHLQVQQDLFLRLVNSVEKISPKKKRGGVKNNFCITLN